MKTELFQSCGHWWVFQIFWHIESNILTASSFRIWNSPSEISSSPLALLVVMLPKAHIASHSNVPGFRWVIYLQSHTIMAIWVMKIFFFLYSSSVYYCHLFLKFSASVRSIWFLFFIMPIFVWNIPFVSLIFLKRYLVLPILLFSSFFALFI